jgi:hypothetical protein
MKKIFYLLTITALLMAALTNCDRDIAVTGVKIDETSLTLGVGETKTLISTVLPENATNKLVTWVSSDMTVATVTSNGKITTHSIGETTIEVRTIDGAFTANCAVNVVAPPTPEELITQDKGWFLTAATSTPAFEMMDGDLIENLFDGFFWDCELDDIMFFKKDGIQILNFGKNLCEDQIGKEMALGYWKIKDRTILEFQLPYFLDENGIFYRLQGEILILDQNTLQIRLPLAFDDGTKMAKRGFVSLSAKTIKSYDFTLTYTKGK